MSVAARRASRSTKTFSVYCTTAGTSPMCHCCNNCCNKPKTTAGFLAFTKFLEMANQTPYNNIASTTADGTIDHVCDTETSSLCSQSSCETIYILLLPDGSPGVEKGDDDNVSTCTLSTKGSFYLGRDLVDLVRFPGNIRIRVN